MSETENNKGSDDGEDETSLSSQSSTDDSVDDLRISPEAFNMMANDAAYERCHYHDNGSSIEFTRDEEPTEQELRIGADVQFNDTLQKIIDDADKLSAVQNVEETIGPDEDIDIYNVDNMPKKSIHKNILGDLFHFMDRSKLPIHHEYKVLFFWSLRAAVFVMMKSELKYLAIRQKSSLSFLPIRGIREKKIDL